MPSKPATASPTRPSTPSRATPTSVAIPEAALLVGADLPEAALARDVDGGQYVKVPTTSTSACRTEPLGLQYAIGGRSVRWSGTDEDGGSWSLGAAVRVLSGTGAVDQVGWLRRTSAAVPGPGAG